MIKIDGKEVLLEDYGVSWGNFFRKTSEGVKEGVAPRFSFLFKNGEEEEEVMLELSYKIEEFKAMKNGVEVDVTDEIVDIAYWGEDWISPRDCPYECRMTRIDDDNFWIKFRCDDDIDEVKIEIDEKICMKK